jgi:tetratricopeptide (TPR) repeat protein
MQATTNRADRYGLPISTTSDRAAELYAQGQETVLSHGVEPAGYFEAAIAEDPDFALAHAGLAMVRLRDLHLPLARGGAETAVRLSASATRREQQHAAAVADATSGRGALAIERMREHLQEFPRDALLLNNTVTSLLFAGRQDEMVIVTEGAEPAYATDDWFFLGLHAFALQEVRRYEEARSAALTSLQIYPLAAFTTHALAHVFYETGEFDEGNGFMPGWLARYDRRGGMHLHLSWHLALFLLARGEYGRVFELYDSEIRPSVQPGSFQLYDPVSLLWRTDAYSGRSRPELWQELSSIAGERSAQPGMVFADLHHGMALAATRTPREKIDGLLQSFRARGERGNAIAGEVALPLMQGLVAFANGEYEEAVQLIEPIEGRIYLVGGSRAQREVFHDTLLEALLRTDRFEAAERRLRERLDRRPSPRDFYRLSRAQAGAGNTTAARMAANETVSRWPAADDTADEPAAARTLQRTLALA